ncbi:4'-phosphopantetheinyl transferase superfamily protein [uncultured Flavobacterium sp.]|uniref:4'-phosphopantetheinyl transferase family protein n=1 Tax=uncultured Flavobacterium sp. TaxID=165435 RepID=UPI0030CA51A0
MPFYKKISINNATSVFIWKIEEDYDELYSSILLKKTSIARLQSMKDVRHQNGFLSIRHLLKIAGYDDFDLYYDEKGKPHLRLNNGIETSVNLLNASPNEKHISISHSFKFSAIIISDEKVGIDIELRRDKVQLIAKKFIDEEFNFLDTFSPDYSSLLTVIWGAKESIYKLYNQKGLFFIENIEVFPFSIEDKEGTARVTFKNEKSNYYFTFEEIESYTLVYVVENSPNLLIHA